MRQFQHSLPRRACSLFVKSVCRGQGQGCWDAAAWPHLPAASEPPGGQRPEERSRRARLQLWGSVQTRSGQRAEGGGRGEALGAEAPPFIPAKCTRGAGMSHRRGRSGSHR